MAGVKVKRSTDDRPVFPGQIRLIAEDCFHVAIGDPTAGLFAGQEAIDELGAHVGDKLLVDVDFEGFAAVVVDVKPGGTLILRPAPMFVRDAKVATVRIVETVPGRQPCKAATR